MIAVLLVMQGNAWAAASAIKGAEAPVQLSLTPDEREWIRANPSVRVAVSPGLPPYYEFAPDQQRPHGFVIEVMGLLAERTGLVFEFQRHTNYYQAQEAVVRGWADALPFVMHSPEQRRVGLRYLRPVLSTNMVLAVRRDIPDISPASNFGGYRVAVERGSAGEQLMQQQFPDATLVSHDLAGDALRAVASGDADIFLGYRSVAVYFIEKYLMANVQVRGTFGPGVGSIGPAVREDLPMLQRILDKALSTLTQSELNQLAQQWLPEGTLENRREREVVLSEAERAWIETNGRIRIGYDARFAPIVYQTDLTQMRGLGADFIRLAASKVGLTILQEVGGSFADVYQKGLRGDIDVLVGAARTIHRRGDYDFVGPFVRVPTGIVTRTEQGLPITKLDEVGRRRLALLDDHFLIPQLRTRYPMMELLTFPDQDAVLGAVAARRADVAVGNLKVINQLIDDHYTGSVRVSGTVPDADSELYFAVRRDLPELSLLLRKGLDGISDAEVVDIERRWLSVPRSTGVSWAGVIRGSVVMLLLLAALMVYLWLLHRGNRRLRRARELERSARELAEETTAARGRFLGYMSHELRGAIGAIAAGSRLLKGDLSPERRDRLADAINASAEGFLNVMEATLQFEQQLDRPLELQPSPHDIRALWSQMLAPMELGASSKGIQLESSLSVESDDECSVVLDAPRLRQVFNNVVGNAIKFTSEGTVWVHGRLHGEGDACRFELEVRDSGPGLSTDDIERLFQPYAQGVQGQRLRQGAGLGLAISRQIVDAMGGHITANSVATGGARFVVDLPLPALAPVAVRDVPKTVDV